MTDHARTAAETITPAVAFTGNYVDPNVLAMRHAWRQDQVDHAAKVIQYAFDSATADLRQAYNEALNALEASHKRRDSMNLFLLEDGWTQTEIDEAVKRIREAAK